MTSTNWDEMVLVGLVARRHGNRGQIIVNPETDFPEKRFQVGRTLYTRLGDRIEEMTITAVRFQKGRPIIGFRGVITFEDADKLAGSELRILSETLTKLPDNMYYRHELIGCEVRTEDCVTIGTVAEVEGPIEKSYLVIRENGEIMVPLTAAICSRIDLMARVITIAPPEGLLELNR